MISIIIPTRNEEKYIGQGLKQFLPFKKKFALELIVSDGDSSDNTVRIAKKFADKIIRRRENCARTIAEGRNHGAMNAKGSLLMFFDADVRIPDVGKFLSRVVCFFYNNKKYIAATTNIKVYEKEQNLLDFFVHLMFNRIISFSTHVPFFHLSKGECQIVRKSAFEAVGGYDEGIVLGEDNDLFWRLCRTGKTFFFMDLCVFHSPRRFRKEGYLRVLVQYLLSGITLLFFRRSHLKEWKPVR